MNSINIGNFNLYIRLNTHFKYRYIFDKWTLGIALIAD